MNCIVNVYSLVYTLEQSMARSMHAKTLEALPDRTKIRKNMLGVSYHNYIGT